MNRYAYLTTGLAIKALYDISKARIHIHGQENIPTGSNIFVINHFTRIETFLLPYQIFKQTGKPVWSLADYGLFESGLAGFLEKVGAVSTKDPDRDLLIVKTLLTGEASWIIFPEGRMVKSKKVYEKKKKKGRFVITAPTGKHPPHTGAATLALRTEFYRQRIGTMLEKNPDEAKRLMDLYQIDDAEPVLGNETYIVPVNITFYPIRAKENIMSKLASKVVGNLSDRMVEEMMTEGTMLLSGVDIDIRFGEPIKISHYMKASAIRKDISLEAPINFDDSISAKKMLRYAASDIMERYMSSIYSMTTVNHDHIFATILRHMPFAEINEMDFRSRVYYASSTLNLNKLIVCRHSSLNRNQVHLLTDDRYGKYDNFISIALESGIVERKEGKLYKEMSFSSSLEFHRARVENPVAVIANEVEPLSEFQEQLRGIAWQPALRIRHNVARHLIQKAVFDFEKDYTNHAKQEDAKKSPDVGAPFLLKSDNRDIGIILVHGYMAAPLEVKGLADYLNRMGFWVGAPRLKGHGTSPEDLAGRTYMEWIETVEEAYAIMRNKCFRVVVGGFSTGAGLALDLASRVDGLSGVFAVSPPMQLQDFNTRFVPAVNVWNKIMEKMNLNGAKKEFIENETENPHINYIKNPISGIREIELLMDSLGPRLKKIDIPALVVQSIADPVVNPKGSRKIFASLGSEEKEYLLLNIDRHGILLGDGSERVYKAIGDFLERIR